MNVGDKIYTSKGQLEILEFFEEDGIQKAQCNLRMYDPRDGVSIITDEPVKVAMPVEKLPKIERAWQADMLERQRVEEKMGFVRNPTSKSP